MRILVVGGGGREHALAWKIAQSPLLSELFIAPGNPGTAALGTNVPILAEDIDGLIAFATRKRVELIVVGPEAPLASGLADAAQRANIPTFGPLAAAARLEASKAFAKALMYEAGVPTAAFHVFDQPEVASQFVLSSDRPWVVKADGLAAGKGVVVPNSVEATLAAIEQISRTSAGQRLVLEELLQGEEVSLLALCDGKQILPLLPAQDHKRIGDGDTGPNTGGMGAYTPTPALGAEQVELVKTTVLEPVVRLLNARGTPYRGVLFAGLMLTSGGIKVLEFNARFGDPETQAILPLLDQDLLPVLRDCAAGTLGDTPLRWKQQAAVCVVISAAGYPATPRRGDPISGLEQLPPDVLAFHAGTATEAGGLVTAGGRVLNLVASGPSLRAARDRAYEVIEQISFEGMHYRRDIAARGLGQDGRA